MLARSLEAGGLATVALTMIPELTEIVGTPRALAVGFPFGAPFGDPGAASLQRSVLSEALALVDRAVEPGGVRESAARWRDGSRRPESGE